MTSDEVLVGKEMSDAFLHNYKLLQAESDRGAVLVASSVIEKALAGLIAAFLLENDAKNDELFVGSNPPLGTLESKILIAYRLGLIRKVIRDSLSIFRRIRNDFAHNIETYSFDNQSVKNRLNEIYSLRDDQSSALDEIISKSKDATSTREKFLLFFAMDMAALQRIRLSIERLAPLD
ncbi:MULTISPECIES: MltR family transcriptional regulator [Klebsiella]|uniref:DUF4145 domain-containing protein n=1 Tax=Klebsiella grimontii TaxID=2058152 RepID=A0A285B083_9ENTR|nr:MULTISPECIES: MltR family transcriptional regulator [Klebsiella]WLP18269.1 MltR family transcriptional regulator [Klebsiella michiganensis]CAA0262178.1 Uncharacterised protein [Klebsiella oxytoca]SNU34302.1 conserved hypothetical protein [Klebsiella grimontii]